jgi:hypothetical protein
MPHTIKDPDDMPYGVYLSQDPFEHILPTEIMVKGDHETLGMQTLECPQRRHLQLTDKDLSTPGSRNS